MRRVFGANAFDLIEVTWWPMTGAMDVTIKGELVMDVKGVQTVRQARRELRKGLGEVGAKLDIKVANVTNT